MFMYMHCLHVTRSPCMYVWERRKLTYDYLRPALSMSLSLHIVCQYMVLATLHEEMCIRYTMKQTIDFNGIRISHHMHSQHSNPTIA